MSLDIMVCGLSRRPGTWQRRAGPFRPIPVAQSPPSFHQEGASMLVLSRQRDETIMIGDDIEVTVVDIRGDKVRLGINAPRK